MNRSTAIFLGSMLLAASAMTASAIDAGFKGRLAGSGADAAYYLATDREGVELVSRVRDIRVILGDNPTLSLAGVPRAMLEKELARCEQEQAALVQSGRLVAARYNTLVTATEKAELIKFPLVPDPGETYGSNHSGTLLKVHIDEGPLQGRELFVANSYEMKSRDLLVATDRVWIQGQANAAIPAGLNLEDTEKFWWAYLMKDGPAAQALIDAAKIVPVPPGLQGTVTDDKNNKYAEIEVVSDKGPVKIWVMKEMLSLQPPSAPAPLPTP
jgi:hypothetical protein